ncbi:MAG TPA: CoA transferase, partial [Candidatus Entotheonella sp.]
MKQAATHHTTKPAAHHAAHRQPGVLSGIRVLDFTWKTVGPWAPRLLTHYGAEVIHVERAGGWDDHRFSTHRSLTTDAPEPNHVQGEKPLYTDPYFNTL